MDSKSKGEIIIVDLEYGREASLLGPEFQGGENHGNPESVEEESYEPQM